MNPRSLIKKIRLLFNGTEESQAEPMSTAPRAVVTEAAPPPRAIPKAVPATLVTQINFKEQSEWMLSQIGAHAKALVGFSTAGGPELAPPSVALDVFLRHDVSALMLGYKITGVAYRRKYQEPSREVLRLVRTAMVSMLLKAGRDHVQQAAREKGDHASQLRPLNLSMAEDHVRAGDAEILTVVTNLQNQTRHPFQPFIVSLVPTFTDGHSGDALLARYEAFFASLLTKSEDSLQQRKFQ